MRRFTIGLLVALLLFSACRGKEDPNDSPPAAEETDNAATPEAHDEYIIVDGNETPIEESCVDTSGQYVGNLPEGGLFILRGGSGPDESFVDYLPSQEADPLSSKKAEDTTTTVDGDFVMGTSTVYTEDGANSLEINFGVVIDDVEEGC